MDIPRRDALKLVVASIAAGGTAALAGCGVARPEVQAPQEKERKMSTRPLMVVRILADPVQPLGAVPHGVRTFVPVKGGDFEGERLRGRILPGGGDWLLLRADGVLELDLRITLETDDHALVDMRFVGVRHGPAEVIAALARGEAVDPARYYFRTLPRFEVSAEKYAFLNRVVTVGRGETRPDGAIHRIDEVL